MAHVHATPDAHALFWSRQPKFPSQSLTTTWEQVLADPRVSSKISVDLIDHWRNIRGLKLDHDPSDHWVTHVTTSEGGRECADAMLCTMQDVRRKIFCTPMCVDWPRQMLDDNGDESHRILRYIMLKFALKCRTVPTSLFLRAPESINFNVSAQGGFSDVYQASLDGNTVALKKLRLQLAGNGANRFSKVRSYLFSSSLISLPYEFSEFSCYAESH